MVKKIAEMDRVVRLMKNEDALFEWQALVPDKPSPKELLELAEDFDIVALWFAEIFNTYSRFGFEENDEPLIPVLTKALNCA